MKRMAMRVSWLAAAECVHNEQALVDRLVQSDLLHCVPGLGRSRVVVVLVLRAGPPHGVLGGLVHDDELILGGAAGVDASHDVDCAQLADLALFVAFQAGLGLLSKQLLVGGVVNDVGGAGNAVLLKIQRCHIEDTSSFLALQWVSRTSFSEKTAHRCKGSAIVPCIPLYINVD